MRVAGFSKKRKKIFGAGKNQHKKNSVLRKNGVLKDAPRNFMERGKHLFSVNKRHESRRFAAVAEIIGKTKQPAFLRAGITLVRHVRLQPPH